MDSDTLVQALEYAACVWDPYQEYLYDLEKIQQRAARWVLSDYNTTDWGNFLKLVGRVA